MRPWSRMRLPRMAWHWPSSIATKTRCVTIILAAAGLYGTARAGDRTRLILRSAGRGAWHAAFASRAAKISSPSRALPLQARSNGLHVRNQRVAVTSKVCGPGSLAAWCPQRHRRPAHGQSVAARSVAHDHEADAGRASAKRRAGTHLGQVHAGGHERQPGSDRVSAPLVRLQPIGRRVGRVGDFSWGTGRNGKGTIVGAVTTIAGDYAVRAPMETFMERSIPNTRRKSPAWPARVWLPQARWLTGPRST